MLFRSVYDQAEAEVKSPPGNVLAAWTDDDSLSTRINDHVAFYTGQDELADAIQKGLDMREKGFLGEATKYLGRATKIAAQSGNEETMRRLKKVVDVINANEGTVQLKKFIAKADEMDLDLCSTRTARTKQSVSQGSES